MNLRVSVPDYTADDTRGIEIQPANLKKWLEGLPMLDAVETGHQVHKALKLTNRLALDHEQRLRLLELYREPVGLVCTELRKQFSGGPQALTDKGRRLAELVKDFGIEMANGYKRALIDAQREGKTKPRHADRLVIPLHRSIRYIGKVMLHAYEFYKPLPDNSLAELHQLYQFAAALGIANAPVDDPQNQSVANSSIEHVYKQALLLALSDPYHLPIHMVNHIDAYLDRWAPLAILAPASTKVASPSCLFVIDLEADAAPRDYAPNERLAPPERYRLLSALQLVRSAHAQLTSLRKGHTDAIEGLSRELATIGAQDMLKRVVASWGINPKRVFPRKSVDNGHVQVAIGLDTVGYFINGEQRFLTSAKRMGPVPRHATMGSLFVTDGGHARRTVGAFKKKRFEDTQEQRTSSTWEFVDESAGGVALEHASAREIQIKVGDIIATRVPSDEDWTIGVVRWMKYASLDHLEIGTQHISPSAQPIAIKTLDERHHESHFMPGLLLPEIPPLKQKTSVIAPRGVVRSDHVIYMDDGEMLRRINATRLVEVTGAFERFEFEYLVS